MADVTTTVSWNGELSFTGTNAKGHQTMFDGDARVAASPVEVLLEALGACMAIDLVLVLEKSRTPAKRIEVALEGDRHSPEPRYFTTMRPRFDVWGDGIKPSAVTRALRLSLTKYCSVFHSLRSDLVLQASYRLHATGAEASGDYLNLDISTPTDELLEPTA